MPILLPWNKPTEGQIKSPSLNLTKLINYVAVAISGLTVVSSAAAEEEPSAAGGGDGDFVDWLNFDDGQRLVIVVAVLAAVAVVNAADLLARALATSRSTPPPSPYLLPTPQPVRREIPQTSGEPLLTTGKALAIDTGNGTVLFVDNDDRTRAPEWVQLQEVSFGSSD